MVTKLLEINNNRGILVDRDSNHVVLMVGGFERSTTTEKKFKIIADNINISSFRFDYSGVGLSDGDFSNITVNLMKKEIDDVLTQLKRMDYKKFSVVAHSLSACVVIDINFEKKVLIAPALNQEELLRYWFALSSIKKQKVSADVDWRNYKKYFNEDNFSQDCKRDDKMTKQNYISSAYFLENKDRNYSNLLKSEDNILHIHGDKDDKVPIESLSSKFTKSIIVNGGDHDLERPDMVKQWINFAIKFIED